MLSQSWWIFHVSLNSSVPSCGSAMTNDNLLLWWFANCGDRSNLGKTEDRRFRTLITHNIGRSGPTSLPLTCNYLSRVVRDLKLTFMSLLCMISRLLFNLLLFSFQPCCHDQNIREQITSLKSKAIGWQSTICDWHVKNAFMNITDGLAIETKFVLPSTKKCFLANTCTISLLQWWLVHPDKNTINCTSTAIKFYFACTAKSPCNLFLFSNIRWIFNFYCWQLISTTIQNTLKNRDVWYTNLTIKWVR